jgi:acetyl-CoA carboxylase biotin carboxylase subunit
VLVVSEADRESLPSKMADRSICIGPAPANESYLKIELLITAALGTNSDAIHPGYGFLSENAGLAKACVKNGLIFVGPSAEAIQKMGNKLEAKKIAGKCGVKCIEGSSGIHRMSEAIDASKEIGFPVIIKAAGGGGGRGMKVVENLAQLEFAFDILSSEVLSAFGDGTLFIERYFKNARHVEVQILGDQLGNIVHLGERDCSVQRRYQKIIEESPCSVIHQALRERLCGSAVAIAREIEYDNCGTVEFVLDLDSKEFYFLEVNTRIQVEHPVTEQICGIDIVEHQIRSAAGEQLWMRQDEIKSRGHAIECRINAESSDGSFRPSPGRITEWHPPEDNCIRIDTHCTPGYLIPPFYDSLIAKVISTGSNRQEAISRMQSALRNFKVEGVETTIPFLQKILNSEDYVSGNFNTQWLEKFLSNL